MQKFSYVGKFTDSGSRNTFYRVKDRKYGFKGFENKELAEFAYVVQSRLASKDLAPRVYSPVCKIRVPNYFMGKNGKTITRYVLSSWGYLTEIAQKFRCKSVYCDGYCLTDSDCPHFEPVNQLMSSITEEGIEYIDAHEGNLGYVTRKNRQKALVVIDVGRESIGEVSGDYPDPYVGDNDYNYYG